MSDERLPLVMLDLRALTTLEGRILVHGEEDTGRQAGRSYLCLKDGRRFTTSTTHLTWKRRAVAAVCERIRSCGFENYSPEGRPMPQIRRVGDSESILRTSDT